MREELQFHLDARIAHLVARGHSVEAAREEALRRLGEPCPTPSAGSAIPPNSRNGGSTCGTASTI